MKRILVSMMAVGLSAIPAPAKTITLSAEDCEQMAIIAAHAPRLSWAGYQSGKGVFFAGHQFDLHQDTSLLIRYPIEKIPPGQKILKAEWVLTVTYAGGEGDVKVHRLLAEWGPGVCHAFRQTRPEKLPWTQPGGRGSASDRADKASAGKTVKALGDFTLDVTEDVDLWYTGGAANRGWMLTQERADKFTFPHPYHPADGKPGQHWKLIITYEPQ